MSVDANAAMMTPQFVLTTTMVFGYACGGFILIPVGKTLIGTLCAKPPSFMAQTSLRRRQEPRRRAVAA